MTMAGKMPFFKEVEVEGPKDEEGLQTTKYKRGINSLSIEVVLSFGMLTPP